MSGSGSKMLDGTNFAEWQVQICASLTRNGHDYFEIVQQTRQIKKYPSPEASLRAAIRVSVQVQPKFLLKIPPGVAFDVVKLFEQLELWSNPFRFLDLPAELRNRVYSFAVRNETHARPGAEPCWDIFDWACGHEGHGFLRSPNLPSMTKVSRQVRWEFVEVLTATARFQAVPSYFHLAESDDECFGALMRSWAKSYRPWLRGLRKIFLHRRYIEYTIDYSDALGLRLSNALDSTESPSTSVDDDTREELDAYITTIEEDRKALDLKGRSIIMALICKPEIWK